MPIDSFDPRTNIEVPVLRQRDRQLTCASEPRLHENEDLKLGAVSAFAVAR
jgi:hypothetical protein